MSWKVTALVFASVAILGACFRFVVPAAPAPVVKVITSGGPKFVDGDSTTNLWACYHEKSDRSDMKCFEFRKFYGYLNNRYQGIDAGVQL